MRAVAMKTSCPTGAVTQKGDSLCQNQVQEEKRSRKSTPIAFLLLSKLSSVPSITNSDKEVDEVYRGQTLGTRHVK
jgi:hypothetical protein